MATRVGQQLGNYRLIRLLGKGGFAEVYLGEHVYLETQAAIKVLLTQLALQDMEPFRLEAKRVAHLEHPYIVRVLEFGLDGTTPFLVMSYAPHGTLRERHPTGMALPLSLVIQYVKQVADALQYAHDEHFIHRDVKPENLLVGRRQEVLLSDFGIALLTQTSRSQSMQEVAGTASYMAPEQFQGKPRPASDQYSLGIMVYEWLSGDRPFHGSFTEVASQHLFVPPTPLRERMLGISPAVEQVVMTALAKDPHQRFDSMQTFATALEQASQIGVSQTLPASWPFLPIDAMPQSHSSQLPIELVTTPSQSLIPTERIPPPSQSSLSIEQSNSLRQASPPTAPPQLPKQRASASLPPGTLLCSYGGHWEDVYAMAWSPDGTRIVSGGKDGTAQVWDAVTGKTLLTYRGHSKSVSTVAWSPDGTRIVSSGSDPTVLVWDAVTGRTLLTYRGQSVMVLAVAWSPDGTRIVSGDFHGSVHLWEVFTATKLRTYEVTYGGHTMPTYQLAWSADSTRIISSGYNLCDRTVQVWEASTGTKLATYENKGMLTPDGTRLVSVTGDGNGVQVWDALTGQMLLTYSKGRFPIAWSPDGTRIASLVQDQVQGVQVWQAL